MFHSERSNNHFLLGLIVGGSIGAATTYLFKTKEGRKVQEHIMDRYFEMSKQANAYLKPKIANAMKSSPNKRKTSRRKKR